MLVNSFRASASAFAGPSRRTFRQFHASAGLDKERLVVLGSGWAGYNVARKVDKNLYDVTVVSPNSYFSFTPFLASTAVGTLEYRCATEPIRGIKGVHFAQGWAHRIDFEKRSVEIEPSLHRLHDEEAKQPRSTKSPQGAEHTASSSGELPNYSLSYDKLVLAVGCYSATFGTPGVKEYAHFLKDIRDARRIRSTLLERLEQAMHPSTSPEQRKHLLSLAIVGGGPTGVEFAAELHDFVVQDVYRLYPELKGTVTIKAYDVQQHILSSFDESLRDYAESKFKRDGVEFKGGSKIAKVENGWLELDGGAREPFGLLVWNTGLTANPFVESLEGLSRDEKTKSLHVDLQLHPLRLTSPSSSSAKDKADPSQAPTEPITSVFCLGDNSTPHPSVGGRLPATAQVASQQAFWTAKALNALGRGRGETAVGEFRWKDRGSMVFVGDKRAMVDRSKVQHARGRLAGIAAWFIWRSYYMTIASSWRNRLLVPIYWTLALVFGRDVTRF